MTRKIKFRGKDEQGEWQEGHLLVQLGTHYILTPIWEMYRNEYVETDRSTKHIVSACTVSQFTGILDKNGKEIYEGDIMQYNSLLRPEKYYRYVIAWNPINMAFGCASLEQAFIDYPDIVGGAQITDSVII